MPSTAILTSGQANHPLGEQSSSTTSFRKVHIFTKEGNTFTFHDVFNFALSESVVTFNFSAQSDGHLKHAVFFVKNIAGFTQLA